MPELIDVISSNFDYENFFSARLTAPMTASDTDVFLDAIPTPSEGVLVIDWDVAASREVIFYNSKTASKVTCPSVANGRGFDNSTATTHLSGANVIMAPVRAWFRLAQQIATTSAQGWKPLGYLPNTITNNGNGSYDLVFNSVDLSSTISEQMRLRALRTVTAPTYMGGAFNGSSHYFTKTTPSGTLGTITNNFTLMGWAQPTTIGAVQTIAARMDVTAANGLWLRVEANGTVTCGVLNGGTGNYRYFPTLQSLKPGKRVHVAATWTSGTLVIYINGKSVPLGTVVTAGTAPTTAGTGGDFAIGRYGAYTPSSYWNGYISGVGVFDAVLSASTIRSYMSQGLSGSETNCIGAWDLNNLATDQNSAGNNLTATGGVGYTSGLSPYGTPANGTAVGTYEFALVTKVAYSTNTTLTVQVPEGCAIPTSGGITSIDYSAYTAPFGFPLDKERWAVRYFINSSQDKSSGITIATYYNIASNNFTLPTGSWDIRGTITGVVTHAGVTYLSIVAGISTSSSDASDTRLLASSNFTNASLTEVDMRYQHFSAPLKVTSETTMYPVAWTNQSTTTLLRISYLDVTCVPAGI